MLVAAVVVAIGMTRALAPKRAAEAEAAEQRWQSNNEEQAHDERNGWGNAETAQETLDDDVENTAGAGVEIPVYNSSRGGQLIRHTGYTVSYDADFKTPQWVAWTLTSGKAQGNEPRYDKFQPDPMVRGAKAYPKDYTKSGYDRGHMAPAADMKWSRQAMVESFYMTNVCPQNRNLNRGDWKELEELERDWALRYGTVSIAAGPIY